MTMGTNIHGNIQIAWPMMLAAIAEQRHREMRDPVLERRMIVIGEIQVVRDAQGIGFIDSQTEHCREDQARGRENSDDEEGSAIRARLDGAAAGLGG
jgi:hypothetical protein